MKVVLFGSSGMIGQRILQEALARGHEVTAVVREPTKIPTGNPRLKIRKGDVLDAKSVTGAADGAEVVISAYGPGSNGDPRFVARAARALVEGVKSLQRVRVIFVGGAGSLEVAPGVMLVDSPQFPAEWKPIALAHNEALSVFRAADIDWTYLSPPEYIQPGERTGRYRTGTDQLLANEKGESRISAEDYAIALLDEAETPKFLRRRFTVAY